MIDDGKMIDVLNYEGLCAVPSINNTRGELFESGTEDMPTVYPLSFRDIKVINSKSDIFRTGRLRFNPDEEEEIYEALSIHDRDNIFSEKEIRKLLLSPSEKHLEKIKSIKSLSLITRMKQVLFQMGMAGQDVNNRMVSVLNQRNEELKQNKIHSDIVITEKKEKTEVELQQIEMMKAMAEMKKQMEEMKLQLEKEKEKNKEIVDDKVEDTDETNKVEENVNKEEINPSDEVEKKEDSDKDKKTTGRKSKTTK